MKKTIDLKVPRGGKCRGCMFLDIGVYNNRADCHLFGVPLYGHSAYGSLDSDTIEKCDCCPVDVEDS